MPRLTTALTAALALLLPFERPLLVGLTHVGGIGSGLLVVQAAYAQNAITLYDLGLEKFNIGDYQGAISDFTKVIKLDPASRSGYYARAMAKSNLGQYKSAVKDYTKALRIDPDFAAAYVGRSEAKKKLGNIKGAPL